MVVGWEIHPVDLNGDGVMDLFVYVPASGAFVKIFNHLNGAFTVRERPVVHRLEYLHGRPQRRREE